jgi:1A family penicillin-binding protein
MPLLRFLKKKFSLLHKKIRKFVIAHKGALLNVLIGCFALGIFLGAGLILWAATLKTPDLDSFDSRLAGLSTKLYDRTGDVLLYDVNQTVRRTVVPYDEISPYLKNATISIEDAEFYSHSGINFTSIIRSVFVDIIHWELKQGGSTITQQVIKNSLLTPEKTITRKLKEWILAIKLERSADKDFILNLYLNMTPYGGNIYGVEEASKAFFKKSSKDVTIAEAAYIAAVAQAPTYYSPFGKHRQDLEDRKNLVLSRMLDEGYITKDQYGEAKAQQVEFSPKATNSLKAPHFVMFVLDYLEKKYGEEAVQEGGLKVITSLNYDMQAKAEEMTKEYVVANQKKFNAENASIVAIDPKTGQILTMVGSRDYFDQDIQGNFNVATAHRQPGSSFKPFVYLADFNKGYTPDTILFDVKTEFNSNCSPDGVSLVADSKCYHPPNYEGGYKGPMTMRAALAQSRNIPAVKALYLAGIEQTLDVAKAFGVQNLGSANGYGLSLALGTAEVSPLDMTTAFAGFANNGAFNPYTGIIKVEDRAGNVLEEFKSEPTQVYPEEPVLELNDILSDAVARNSIFTLNFIPGRKVALKTGTTNDSRDAWIIGYTPNLAVGAWMGNNDNRPMSQVASALIVGPLWQKFMIEVLKDIPVEDFKASAYASEDKGNLKPVLRGVWQSETGPHTILNYVNRDDPQGDYPNNPASDSQFNNWEAGVLNWAITSGYALPVATSTPDNEEDETNQNRANRRRNGDSNDSTSNTDTTSNQNNSILDNILNF